MVCGKMANNFALCLTQATLGIGTAPKKSVVQCNVGDKSPVFLCSLFPEKAESCQLNLEFEEADEVVFSVIGPQSVHLTGYFLGASGQRYNLNDELYPLMGSGKIVFPYGAFGLRHA